MKVSVPDNEIPQKKRIKGEKNTSVAEADK
jgi:hypothetical protein